MEEKTRDLSDANDRLKIYTLGRFIVLRGKKSLNEQTNRSYRMWELFKYLLTNRGKGIPAESITEILWPGSDYAAPPPGRAYLYLSPASGAG
jgi:two-component SAPR family response regulator